MFIDTCSPGQNQDPHTLFIPNYLLISTFDFSTLSLIDFNGVCYLGSELLQCWKVLLRTKLGGIRPISPHHTPYQGITMKISDLFVANVPPMVKQVTELLMQ